MCTGCPANCPRASIQPRVLPGRGSGAGSPPVRAASRATAAARDGQVPGVLGDLDGDLVRLGPHAQAGDAGLLEQVRGGADDPHVGGQQVCGGLGAVSGRGSRRRWS